MLITGNTISAFELSTQFLYFRGILESLDLVNDPTTLRTNSSLAATASSMQWKFRELLKQQGEMYGTSDLPMGLFTLQWLEEKGRPIALLEAGKLVPHQLVKFLEPRPQLAWIYYAMEGNLC